MTSGKTTHSKKVVHEEEKPKYEKELIEINKNLYISNKNLDHISDVIKNNDTLKQIKTRLKKSK
jgi:hypothetical protein